MIVYVFLGIITLFILLLGIKKWLPFEICVICLSVSLTWLVLLGLYRIRSFGDPALLALLMGQSVVGVYYALEKRVPKNIKIFRLPALLTLTLIAYIAATLSLPWQAALLTVLTWGLFTVVYFYRSNAHFSMMVKKLIECCGKW